MASFETFHSRMTMKHPSGSEITISENGSITAKSSGDFTFNGDITALTRLPLSLNDYQEGAISTAVYKDEYKVIYPALKLTGEAGEVSEKIGKVLRDKDGEFTDDVKKELAKELGDVLWYIAALSRDIGYTLEEVAQMNLDKLASRKERGVLGGNGDNR